MGTIFVECFADHLLFAQLKYEHEETHSGIGEVGNRMKHKRMKGKKCLGIIDNDKRQSDYFTKDFERLHESGNLIFLKHHTEKHFLIKIKPVVEGFILAAAHEAKVNPAKHKLPNNINELKKLTQKKEITKNPQFINFVHQIVASKRGLIKELSSYVIAFYKEK